MTVDDKEAAEDDSQHEESPPREGIRLENLVANEVENLIADGIGQEDDG